MNLHSETLKQKRIEYLERDILGSAYGLTNKLEELRELDPVIASNVFKQVLQYINEKVNNQNTWTIEELIQLGYIKD